MTGIELIFLFGCIVGFLIGSWIGGRWVLIRMRHDEHVGVDSNYQRRKDKYINKKG